MPALRARGFEPRARHSLPEEEEDEEEQEGFGFVDAAILPADADALVEMAQQYPREAAWFIKVVTLLGVLFGLLVSLPCCLLLWGRWAACGHCNRPLRHWIVVHCAFQLLQLPIRLLLFLEVRRAERLRRGIEECVQRLTSSWAWKASKMASMVIGGWLVLGVVWLLNSQFCGSCPSLYRLCAAAVALAALRLALTVVAFKRAFPAHGEQVPAERPAPRGAPQAAVEALPLVEYSPRDEGPETACAICLCDFECGDMLRQLPCGHKFDRGCIDRWLMKNKLCPLCLQDIEEPPPRSSRLHRRAKAA